jgi:hypothetical protein
MSETAICSACNYRRPGSQSSAIGLTLSGLSGAWLTLGDSGFTIHCATRGTAPARRPTQNNVLLTLLNWRKTDICILSGHDGPTRTCQKHKM